MDDLAALESKIQSLKAVFSSPVPLERSWISQGDESGGNSRAVDANNIDKLSSPIQNRGDMTEKRLQNTVDAQSPIIAPNEESSLFLNRVEHQATLIREKMKVIHQLKEKIEKNKAACKDQVNKLKEDHSMEVQAIVATLDEARANLVNQRKITQKEREKGRIWETKYTKLHENLISLHESLKKAHAEVEAERHTHIAELEHTKSELIETQQKLSQSENELIQFRSENENKKDTHQMLVAENKKIKEDLGRAKEEAKASERNLAMWKTRAKRAEKLLSSTHIQTDEINLDSSPVESGHTALSAPKLCKDSALRLLYEKRLAALSYENSRLNLKLNANYQ